MFDQFFKLPLQEQAKIIKTLKQYVKNRDKMLMEQGKELYKDYTKSLKKEGGWTKDKTMKKVFSIPMEVYMANPTYWQEIIDSKQFNKHPEWKVG